MIGREVLATIAVMLMLSFMMIEVPARGESYQVELDFPDLPSGKFSGYTYDVDRDGTPDIVVSANSHDFMRLDYPWSGLTRIHCPALQGIGSPEEPELSIEFLGGATGRLAFDFAVSSQSESTYPEAYIQVYGANNYYQTNDMHVSGSPAEGRLEIDLTSVGTSSCIWFYPGMGNAFVLDNLKATVGTTHAPVGQKEISDFDDDGDVDACDLASLAADPTFMELNSFALQFGSIGSVRPCSCLLTSETGNVHASEQFQVEATVLNGWITGESLFLATYVSRPDSTRYPLDPDEYVRGPYAFTLTAGESFSATFTHMIPDDWAAGTYTYHGALYVSGRTTLAECEYQFQVLDR